MNIKHYTSIEQSKKLLELGLNSKTADFEYKCIGFTMHTTKTTDNFKYKVIPKEQNIPHEQVYDISCWSLGALLEAMPIIKKDVDEYLPYFIKGSEIWKGEIQSFWYCSYALLDDSNTELIAFQNSTAVEAAFNMVVWLLENGYIKQK